MALSYLKSERIYLRAVEPEDLEIVYEMENNPSMWDVSSFTVPYSRYVLRQYIENTQSDMYADKQLRLMIIQKESHKVLGIIDITDFVPLHSRGAVGIVIRHEYRKEGYAEDALILLRQYAFDFLLMRQLYAHIAIDNEASLKLFEACGFTSCGVMKEWLLTKNGYRDAVILQCLNPRRK